MKWFFGILGLGIWITFLWVFFVQGMHLEIGNEQIASREGSKTSFTSRAFEVGFLNIGPVFLLLAYEIHRSKNS